MNRNQLRYFVSAAEHRSFTKAAEQYYISQTAVTQQIQQLEQTLGCELFDRSTRPVSLTSAGKSFLLDAKAILERMSRAQERVHDAATGLTGTLRVGYVRGYERSDLSVLMRHFHQKNGNVLISFYRCSTDVLAAGLLHQEYDIVFTWDSTNLRTQEGVTFQTVEKARLVVALYAGHPLTQRRQLTRQELRGENILYMSPDAAPDSYGDAFFMQRYAEAGYKPNILFRSADTESILMMVAAEEGIADRFTLSIESGVLGGVPLSGLGLGASRYPEAIYKMADVLNLYDGGCLDMAVLGLAEMDGHGNVNVSSFGGRVTGPGGFIDIAQHTKTVLFVGTFTAGGLRTSSDGGKLTILQEGRSVKFRRQVEQITFSGNYAVRTDKRILAITERAVFRLTEQGLELIEIAPGVDLERDILAHMEFTPIISPDLKEMDPRIFRDGPMGLTL